MIIDVVLNLIGFLLGLAGSILPDWVIWPSFITDLIRYVVDTLIGLDFIFPISDTIGLFTAVNFLLWFFGIYWSYLIVMYGLNYLRGR